MAKQVNTPEDTEKKMALGRKNYICMLIGAAVIILGFVLMAGGGSDDPNVFNTAMFSTVRITIAPILVIGGLAFEVFAIMKRFK